MYRMKRKIRTRRVVRRKGQFHAVLWLVGLAVLAMTDSWWPGILILVVISILLESAVKRKDQSEGGIEEPETVTGEKPDSHPCIPAACGDGCSSSWNTSRGMAAAVLPQVRSADPRCGRPLDGQRQRCLPLLRIEPSNKEILI